MMTRAAREADFKVQSLRGKMIASIKIFHNSSYRLSREARVPPRAFARQWETSTGNFYLGEMLSILFDSQDYYRAIINYQLTRYLVTGDVSFD